MSPQWESTDDGYDEARDAYLTGEGPPVTAKQRREFDAEVQAERDARRYGW